MANWQLCLEKLAVGPCVTTYISEMTLQIYLDIRDDFADLLETMNDMQCKILQNYTSIFFQQYKKYSQNLRNSERTDVSGSFSKKNSSCQ